jgi:hypothetical protein
VPSSRGTRWSSPGWDTLPSVAAYEEDDAFLNERREVSSDMNFTKLRARKKDERQMGLYIALSEINHTNRSREKLYYMKKKTQLILLHKHYRA